MESPNKRGKYDISICSQLEAASGVVFGNAVEDVGLKAGVKCDDFRSKCYTTRDVSL